ncbi:NAD(P)H-binding protein [Sphingomonas sp. JC676]|uniref:NAD(P)H-binding protein n=1 Tax=Sphingomonas sp. JC676 TaxID=2768065 RepID=UPI001657D2AC|nr:NAD(P)H-binding protein [Sphingomonas sp. JC676]MBC9032871.1 NAD(P)H-binding protein [Sphingomonas sp. JC676]
MAKTVLVLGATGGVGGEAARALLRHGWKVRGLARQMKPGMDTEIEWTQGDAMDRDAVLRAAKGVDAIVHAVNPPGYREWEKLVLPMIDNSIAAALANDARVALPGTIYNYDAAETPVAQPDSPQHPSTRKGRIRGEMEKRLEASGARVVILRAGDFFGPRPGNSWLSQGMVTPGKRVRAVTNPASKGVGHAWAYLPDVGETFARLLDRDRELPRFARYHFAGTWDADGAQFAAAVAHASGNDAKVRGLPWALLPLAALFSTTLKELIEMRTYWRHPLRLDNRELVELLGEEPHTPLAEALPVTLEALGCTPA